MALPEVGKGNGMPRVWAIAADLGTRDQGVWAVLALNPMISVEWSDFSLSQGGDDVRA